MKFRNILAMLLICIIALNPVVTFAEDPASSGALTYQGGVVERGYVGGIKTYRIAPPLELAYVLSNSPYIILNSPTVWDVVISGGTAPYTCKVWLAYQSDLSMDPFAQNSWATLDRFTLDGDSFTYTFTKSGRYFWQFEVTDAEGQTLTFQSRIYESYTDSDETDEQTVAGKVNSIIAEYITPGMSDYTRALVLHDWLIYNANYDYSSDPYYDAAGVLLYERGVCDSYARAYLMLMTAAGVDCMIVTGTAGGGNHACNLVKLDGSWYHVDCTWDDPNEGGCERHTYFCVDDATMALDHTWKQPGDNSIDAGMLVPDADGGKYEDESLAATDYDFTFASIEELNAAFDAELAAGNYREYTRAIYTGTDNISNVVWPAFTDWFSNSKWPELASKRLVTSCEVGVSDGVFYIRLTWVDPSSYIRINEETLIMNIGDGHDLICNELYPKADAFTWTSSDPEVAIVESTAYDSENEQLVISIAALATGRTTITATSADGISDSLDIAVVPAYTPEFNLTMTESAGGLKLNWNLVPGATEYRVMLAKNGSETVLSTVTSGEYTVSLASLPANTLNELYVKAVRKVGDEDALAYSSEKFEYVALTFASSLPANIVSIGSEAFTGVDGIDSLYIPDGAKTIGAGAFSGSGIDVIRIPASVTSISPDSFLGSDVAFVQTTEGSTADAWFKQHMPGVYIKYE